jgi:hypothetical protein
MDDVTNEEQNNNLGNSGDMSGNAGDMSGNAGDMSGNAGDMSGNAGDMSGNAGDMSGNAGNAGNTESNDPYNPSQDIYTITNKNTFRTDYTLSRGPMFMFNGHEWTNDYGVENTPASCSALYSYDATGYNEGMPSNWGQNLQICNMNDDTKALPLSAIDQSKWINPVVDTNDNYVFISAVKSNSGKCYVYLKKDDNNQLVIDPNTAVTFNGECDTNVTAEQIINGEAFTNVKSSKKFKQKKSEEHFESNKNLKCKHRY